MTAPYVGAPDRRPSAPERRPGFSTLVDPRDTSPFPDVRNWDTLAEARAYALARLDADEELDSIALGTADAADYVETVWRSDA